MNRLKDKVAIVTGAAAGIGEATARLFAKEGAKLSLCDVAVEPLEKVVEAINAEGGEAIACSCYRTATVESFQLVGFQIAAPVFSAQAEKK